MDSYLVSSEVFRNKCTISIHNLRFFCFYLKYSVIAKFTLFQNENKHSPG